MIMFFLREKLDIIFQCLSTCMYTVVQRVWVWGVESMNLRGRGMGIKLKYSLVHVNKISLLYVSWILHVY